jgi:hypothetical protein
MSLTPPTPEDFTKQAVQTPPLSGLFACGLQGSELFRRLRVSNVPGAKVEWTYATLDLLVIAIRVERRSVGAAESGATSATIPPAVVLEFRESRRFRVESRHDFSGGRSCDSRSRCREETARPEHGAATLGSRAG